MPTSSYTTPIHGIRDEPQAAMVTRPSRPSRWNLAVRSGVRELFLFHHDPRARRTSAGPDAGKGSATGGPATASRSRQLQRAERRRARSVLSRHFGTGPQPLPSVPIGRSSFESNEIDGGCSSATMSTATREGSFVETWRKGVVPRPARTLGPGQKPVRPRSRGAPGVFAFPLTKPFHQGRNFTGTWSPGGQCGRFGCTT